MAKPFEELALISVPALVQFDPESKARTLLLCQAAAECLTEFGLVKSDLSARYCLSPDTFEVLLGDLTEDGLTFAKGGFQRWLGNTDRWKAGRTLAEYKKALERQWAKSGAAAV